MPIAITDLGVVQKSTAGWGVTNLSKYTSWSHAYALADYWFAQGSPIQTYWVALDMDAGTISQARGPLGRIYGSYMHPNGLYYLTFNNGGTSAGQVASWDVPNGMVTTLFSWPRSNESASQWMSYSDEPHQRMFFGSIDGGSGSIIAWDPVIGTYPAAYQDYGIIDGPADQGARYVHSLQVDASYAYVGLQVDAAYLTNYSISYLVIVNLSTGVCTAKFKTASNLKECLVCRGTNNTTIYVRTKVETIHGSGNYDYTWYSCNGTADPTQVATGEYYANALAENTRVDTFNTTSPAGYTLDWTQQYYPGPDGVLTFYYKKPGDSDFRTASTTLTELQDYPVYRACADFDKNFVNSGINNGPLGKFLTATATNSQLGPAGSISVYDIQPDIYNRLMWVSGYSNELWYYNPDIAYALTQIPFAALPDEAGGARYYYKMVVGYDKKLWLGVLYLSGGGRGSGGANLISYNYPDASIFTAFPTFSEWVFWGLTSNSSKSRLVLNLQAPDNSVSYVVVVPVRNGYPTKWMAPLGAVADQGQIICVETGTLATTNHFVGITDGANYQVYCLNICTQTLVWGPYTQTGKTSHTIDGTSEIHNGQQTSFHGGYVWFYEGNKIAKLDPANGNITYPYDLTGNSYYGQHLWIDDVMYHWDTTTKKLWKITGLV